MATQNSIITVGDSISDRIAGLGWADVVRGGTENTTLTKRIYVEDNSAGSTQIVGDMEPKFIAGGEWANRRADCNIAILQGGVNDIKTALDTAENMWTAMQLMIAHANADGAEVFVMNLTPFKSYSAWSTAFQTIAETYNGYLSANQVALNYTLIDLYTLLEDPATADTLLPAYDDGDGLHPSSPGARDAIAAEVVSVLGASIIEVDMANPIKLWRGAVEPASVSPSGNQLKIWRGAVEPAVATSSTSQGTNNGVNIAIRIGF